MALQFKDITYRVTITLPEPVAEEDLRREVATALERIGYELKEVVLARVKKQRCANNEHSAGWWMGLQCTRCGDID
jgi:type II secretory pathway component PulJ